MMSAHVSMIDFSRNRAILSAFLKELAKVVVLVGFIAGWVVAGVLWCERSTREADYTRLVSLVEEHQDVAGRALDALNTCEYERLTK